MNFWDQRYSCPDYKYGASPHVFLTEQANRLTPSADVLVPGDGEGRNGLWLAQQGHRVTTVDSSAVGLREACEPSASHGVALSTERAERADRGEWSPAPAVFDAVVLIDPHLAGALRHAAHRRLALEAFHPAPLAHAGGGPKDPDMLHTPALLTGYFSDLLAPVLSWEGDMALSEGPGHQGLSHVTRWVGQRLA